MLRDMMPHFDLYQPDSLEAALDLAGLLGVDGWIVAGGQDSWDLLKNRVRCTQAVIDLSAIATLYGVREHEGGIAIAALTKFTDADDDQLVPTRYRLLTATGGRV